MTDTDATTRAHRRARSRRLRAALRARIRFEHDVASALRHARTTANGGDDGSRCAGCCFVGFFPHERPDSWEREYAAISIILLNQDVKDDPNGVMATVIRRWHNEIGARR